MMKRWMIILAAMLGLAVVGGAGYWGYVSQQTAVPTTPPAPVTIAATQGDVQKTVTAPGQLVGTRQQMLGMDVDGRLIELNVRPGTAVSAGDIIAKIDPTSYQNALNIAQIELAQAQDALAQQVAEAELAAATNEALVGSTQAQFPQLTAAEVNLNLAREAEAWAENEYNKALDRHWEPPEVVEAYRLEWQRAIANRQIAESEYNAVLNQRWAVGQQVEAQQTELDRANLAVDYLRETGVNPLLETAVAQAEANLAATVLYAPFDGVVLDVFVTAGEAVGAGTNLVLLADPSLGEVRTTVIEEDLADVQLGLPAELFFDARPDLAVQGTVARLVPQRVIGEARPLYHVYITVDEQLPDGVFPGMTVDASIIVAEELDMVRLPRTLVRPRSDGTAVIQLWQNGRRVDREVTVGLRGDVFMVIQSGLQPGDEVVGE
ncbi:HlyD family efflux transporter periplasmic adaptor subunit [Candidatus Leptofilum sp.]|uniref:HlyD family efflux transporter periplasmic adaptor subunit n=1 Tax=Candidatus Leptofilum sp. TaxID=3241576 RepID=UPI003B5C470B